MAVTTERLVAILEARLDKYEKSLNKAEGITNKKFGRIEKRGTKMEKKLASLGKNGFKGLISGAALAVAPILSVGAALATAKRALDDFDSVAKTADKIGLSTDALQELRFAADQTGVSQNTLDLAMQRFTRRVGEAVQGKGELVGILKQYNIAITDSAGRTRNQTDILDDVADVIKKTGSEQEKLRIAFKAFDSEGAALVNTLKNGSDGLAEFRSQARQLGVVVDEHLLRSSERLKSELSAATTIMDLEFKKALVDLAPILISSARFAGDLANSIGQLVDSMRGLEDRSSSGLEHRLKEIGVESVEAENAILKLKGEQRDLSPVSRVFHKDRIASEINQLAQERVALAAEEQKILAVLGSRDLGKPGASILPTDTGASTKAAAEAERQAKAVKALVASLVHQREQLGRNAEAQELYNLLKQAGVSVESEYGQQIAASLEPLQQQRQAMKESADAMELFNDTAEPAMRSFIDDLIEGKDAGEAFKSVLGSLGGRLIDLGFSGIFGKSGGGAGIFDNLFANGGFTGPGGRNEPAGVVHKGEYVFSKAATSKIGVGRLEAMHNSAKGYASGGLVGGASNILPMESVSQMNNLTPAHAANSSTVSVPISIDIDATGADAAGLSRVASEIAQLKHDLPGRIKSVVSQRSRMGW